LENKHIHIISFDVPLPANYGGVIDVFYKIKYLHSIGYKIHLHCFKYGRDEQDELLKYCASVKYYSRKQFYQFNFLNKSYIIASRSSRELYQNLLKIDCPILFEGLHTCFFLSHPDFSKRNKMVRMHNIEWNYYEQLGRIESNWIKKIYYKSETRHLKDAEEMLKFADNIYTISPLEQEYLSKRFQNVKYLPVFHPNETVTSKLGKGDYVLYHGSLDVNENMQAVNYLIDRVFSKIKVGCIIAGKNPSKSLQNKVGKHSNIKLISNPSNDEINHLIENSHVNILTTFQSTGIKLKLINALYRGRFCLVNWRMVVKTELDELCIVENSANKMRDIVVSLMNKDFLQSNLEKRKSQLSKIFKRESIFS
jgi:hypothetical protein